MRLYFFIETKSSFFVDKNTFLKRDREQAE